ncbi:MAG: hypothetical protein ACE5EC_07080 [Phycisphaerae bacterium]
MNPPTGTPFSESRRPITLLIVWILAFLASASMVVAQTGVDPETLTNNIEKLKFERPIVEYVCAGGFLLTALGIGFKPSKRTHD